MRFQVLLPIVLLICLFIITTEITGETAEERPSVEISVEQQKIGGIKTYTVKPIIMKKTLRTVGTIEYDERLLYTVNTKFEAWIERLYVNYTGRYIKKGEPIAELYSPELISTQEEFLTNLKYLKEAEQRGSEILIKDARKLLDASRQRLLLWDIPQSEIERIEKEGKPFKTLKILSPADGYVIKKYVNEGSRVMPGERLIDIADLKQVWIIAEIYESDMAFLKVLKEANLRLSYLPSKIFRSRIDYIYPEISSSTRTAKVRFVLPNEDHSLKPGMFTEVFIDINLGRRLAIPEDAVIDTGLRSVVYVQIDDETFEPREILTGLRADGMREVLKGLKKGEKVVSHGTFLIDSEAKLKGVKPLPLKR